MKEINSENLKKTINDALENLEMTKDDPILVQTNLKMIRNALENVQTHWYRVKCQECGNTFSLRKLRAFQVNQWVAAITCPHCESGWFSIEKVRRKKSEKYFD
ncbi:MAG: hypothetical protein R6U96_18645 [Promethearchaeia archaeon]